MSSKSLNAEGKALLFTEARTHNAWRKKEVSDSLLRDLHDLMKWGPTSANCCPARILFLRSADAKEKLEPFLMEGNREKTRAAPITAILGNDAHFYQHLPKLFPHNAAMREMFAAMPDLAAETAMRNGSLQGGYFILAARALGLDCGPMSGFDPEGVTKGFFSGTETRANFLCNLGYGDADGLTPRSPRFAFDEACRIL